MESVKRMKNLVLIFFLVGVFTLIFGSGCRPQGQDPSNQDNLLWNFGNVKNGTVLKHVFILHNDSRNTLSIKKIQTSCGCTNSTASRDKILPGGSSEITVVFDTKGYSGKVKQFVYVHTSDQKKPIVKFTVTAVIAGY